MEKQWTAMRIFHIFKVNIFKITIIRIRRKIREKWYTIYQRSIVNRQKWYGKTKKWSQNFKKPWTLDNLKSIKNSIGIQLQCMTETSHSALKQKERPKLVTILMNGQNLITMFTTLLIQTMRAIQVSTSQSEHLG